MEKVMSIKKKSVIPLLFHRGFLIYNLRLDELKLTNKKVPKNLHPKKKYLFKFQKKKKNEG